MKNVLLAVLLLSSCASLPEPVGGAVDSKPTNEGPIPSSGAIKATWDGKHKEWTPILVQALKEHGKTLLQGEYAGVCGEKLQYWVMLISAIARDESGFDPRNTFKEGFEDEAGAAQVSRGLLQMSLDDRKAGCPFSTVEDVYDVKKNLECGVIKASRLVSRDGVIAAGSTSRNCKGMACYWSVTREGPKDGPKKARIFAAARETCL